MVSYEENVYYSPEASGLVTVGEVEWGDGCYSFDLTVVWRKADGSLVYGDDSGCSCPSPFESFKPADLTACTPAELQAHLEELNRDRESYREDRSAQIAELMGAVVDA